MRIISAISGTPSMSKEEVDTFLERRLTGITDEKGDPNIQPVWYDYDKDREKLLVITPRIAKKVQNIKAKPEVYFSIDDENFPYKGVKGKGTVTIIEDPKKIHMERK